MEIAPDAALHGGDKHNASAGDAIKVSSASSSSSSHVDSVQNGGWKASVRYDDDDEEEDVCRICHNPADAENPLRYPCACSGSIKFVHQDCLLQWLNHSNARQCEVCKHAFSFSPVYAENAPARLPFQEFVIGMAMKACHVLQFFLRLYFALSVWLLIIPFITFWSWTLVFMRSFDEAQKLFLSHISTTVILTDCLHGCVVSVSIVSIFLWATLLRDCFRHLRELGGQDTEREDEGNRNGAENVAAHWEMQAAVLEADVEQMVDGLDDGDGEEDVPFDELVVIQGPVFHLVENASTVLANNMIFLGVVNFVPFSLGRIIVHYITWLFSSVRGPILSTAMLLIETALSLVNVTLKNTLSAETNLSSETQDNDLLSQVAEMLKANASGLSEVSINITAPLSPDSLTGPAIGTSQLSDVTTLAIGYMFILSLIFFYIGIVSLIQYTKGEPLTLGRFDGIFSITEDIPSLFRHFLAEMRYLMTVMKVVFLLVIELVMLPLMCGWWLDISTLRMFGRTMSQRVQFFTLSPLTSYIVHWVVGIVFMLQISIFVSLLRGVLRNGVLYFLRDLADPNYNPFRDLIDDPVHKHARRVLLSVAVYGILIVTLVFLPVELAIRMAPSIFPLDITLRTTIKSLLRCWFTVVGWALGLIDFLLPRPEENGGQENGNGDLGMLDIVHAVQLGGVAHQDQAVPLIVAADGPNRSLHASGISTVADEYNCDEQSDSEYSFVLRIVLLWVVAWMTLLIFNSAVIVIPVSLGRGFFSAIPLLPITHGIKCNDLYAFIIGSYVIWTALAGARYSIEHVKTRRAHVLLSQIWKWCGIVIKASALLSLWIFVIPVLIGLLFELLVIVPMRVPVDESPVCLLYQDWAWGLIFLKIWTRLVMLDNMIPLVDESWRIKFERVGEDGFSRLQGLWVLREIVFPIIMKLLTALCVPYVLARGVFPVLGYPLVVNSTVYRFAWLGCLSLSLLCFGAKRFHVWFTDLHNAIRDDRYLIGRRLHNFGEVTEAK